MSEMDHGELNLPLNKRGAGTLDQQIDRHLAAEHRERRKQARAAAQERKAARTTEANRPKLTADDVRGAVAVRDRFGWHRVVRVNAESVTVETPYSWTERIRLAQVLQVAR